MMRTWISSLLAVLAVAIPVLANDWSTGVAYSYDGSGNIRQMGTDVQVYDTVGRLVQSDTNGVRSNYTYDMYGNRTGCLRPGPSDCQPYSIDAEKNRIASAAYDTSGNVTVFEGHSYTYDAFNMQTRDESAGLIREYIYTAGDERIAIYTPTTVSWRWTLRDASGKVLRELTSRNPAGGGTIGTASWAWSKDYVWRDGLLLASRQIEPGASAASTYHYHLDHLGTPRQITNDANAIVGKHSYHAFGPELTTGQQNEPSLTPLKYTGHERDGDLDYMHARYYDWDMGRFLSVDPVMQVKRAMRQPQLWNRYSYALNNPLVYTDPTGKTVYLVTYTTGNADGDEEFKRAAMTRAADLRKQKGFDPKKDTVLVRGVGTKADFRAAVTAANALAPKFGKVGEVSLFSHAGRVDGPIFPGNKATENQFTDGEMATIGVNWESGGCGRFFGCNTGINFTQRFANMQGVSAYGYAGYAGFSSSPNEFSMWGSKGPLYLIHTAGYSNNGVEGSLGKYLGYNDAAIPMTRSDPDPQP